MKKTIIILLAILIILVLALFLKKYTEYKAVKNEIKQENLNYEFYLNKQVYCNDITSLINKAMDSNEKNKVKKDEKGFYIPNNENSVKIQITTIDLDENITYDMESFYYGGMETFYTLYNNIIFECSKIYYNKLGKVSYVLFVQKTK